MDAEKINQLLDYVNDAKNTVQGLLGDSIINGNETERIAVESVFNKLDTLESKIMIARDEHNLGKIEEAAKKLKSVNAILKKEIKSLKEVANRIGQVANAVGTAVNILTKAVSLFA